MSRALDPETASSIQSTNLQEIYTSLIIALKIPSSGPLLEIEFLGSSHLLPPGQHVLQEGNSIAIPTAKLVQAFIIARLIFIKCVRNCPEAKEVELWNATAVMLLMDPEHLTAANARKRLIRKRRGEDGFEGTLEKELRFVDSYLTSRLHRHTKSPTLWGHRRWVLEQYKGIRIEHDILADLNAVVLVAAERHPKNYYAWNHMRWLKSGFYEPFPGDSEAENQCGVLVSAVKEWCLRHPGDTSGFSFLLFCLHRRSGEASGVVCRDVLRLALSFKWTHESVWVFLRTLAASREVTEHERREFFQAIVVLLTAQPEARALVAAKDWCSKYRYDSSLGT